MNYKKFMISGLFLLSTVSIFASQSLPANEKKSSPETVPYENVIEREYNRSRGNLGKYTSIHEIMNQTLRGKSIEQKNQIIADLKSLKHAVHAAHEQAYHDGKRMWYWGYIWKDNEPAIETLAQYGYDISDKLSDFEWESQTDFTKLLWYTTKYTSIGAVGIITLWASQYKLSTQTQPHGIVEMLSAPALAGYDAAKIAAKYTLSGITLSFGAVAYGADYLKKLFPETDAAPAQKHEAPAAEDKKKVNNQAHQPTQPHTPRADHKPSTGDNASPSGNNNPGATKNPSPARNTKPAAKNQGASPTQSTQPTSQLPSLKDVSRAVASKIDGAVLGTETGQWINKKFPTPVHTETGTLPNGLTVTKTEYSDGSIKITPAN